MKSYTYTAIVPKQSKRLQVFSFCAPAKEILEFAQIDRISREEDGTLKGFQRPQVAQHINEIRQYLAKDEAVLPNSVVIAFTKGVKLVAEKGKKTAKLTIKCSEDTQAFVVDGQQRLSALQGLPDKNFEVFVAGILCTSEDELRKQFILINNTKPLPKSLIYELLPAIGGLPHRLTSRAAAASLVERLNYDEDSSLRGQIYQHTNPFGVIRDTALQKVIMLSLSDGALRELSRKKNAEEEQFGLLSGFFGLVQEVFKNDWLDHKPISSRLVHSTGIVSMGFVMEHLYAKDQKVDMKNFRRSLKKIQGKCAWTEGHWNFGENNIRPWNGLQYIPRDYWELSNFLIRQLKA